MRSFLLIILLIAQTSCAFITTAAGSFVGNFGAAIVEDELKKNAIEEKFEKEQLKTEV